MRKIISYFMAQNEDFKFHLNEYSESFVYDSDSKKRLETFFNHLESPVDSSYRIVTSRIKNLVKKVPAYRHYTRLDFEEMPCIKKSHLNESGSKYLNSEYENDQLWIRPTSGTTGRPTDIWYSPEFFFEQQIYGIFEALAVRDKLKDEYFSCDIFAVVLNDSKKIHNRFWCAPNDSFGLIVRPSYDETDYTSYINLITNISKWKPKILSLKPTTLDSFVHHFSEADKLCFQSVDYIITGGSLLTKSTRESVKRILDIPIIDQYGMSEFGPLAIECEKGNYHSISNNHLFEVKDLNSENISKSGSGELVVTSVANEAMPLIRYSTGDIVNLHSDNYNCSCGLKTQVISNIEGRRLHHFIDVDGRLLSPRFFDFIFDQFEKIQDFYVSQSKIGTLIITIVSKEENGEFYNEVLSRLIHLKYSFDISVVIQTEPMGLPRFCFIGDLVT